MKFKTIFKLLILLSILTMISVASAAVEKTERIGFKNIPEGYQVISDNGIFGDHESTSNILIPDNLANEFKNQFKYMEKSNELRNIRPVGKEANKNSIFIQVPNSDDVRRGMTGLSSAKTTFGSNITKIWNRTFSDNIFEMYRIQDLSGDGLDDVLVLLKLANKRYQLVILKGTDGNELWNMSVSPGMEISWNIASDLDGDGFNDVLITTIKTTMSPPFSLRADYKVYAKKGNNGKTLWKDSTSGSDSAFISVSPYSITDVDGDNLTDIIITKSTQDMMTGKSSFIIRAFKGLDKTLLWSDVTETMGYVFGYAYSVGDLDKDGISDVLIGKMKGSIISGAASSEIIARIGKNGIQLWNQSVDAENGFAYTISSPVGDVSGDGTVDILLGITRKNLNGSTDRITTVVAGNDGSPIWIRNNYSVKGWQYGDIIPMLTDLNKDGLMDLFYIDYTKVSANDYMLTVSALEAKNGESLWTEVIHGKKDQYSIWPDFISQDMDGDTFTDVLMTYYDSGNASVKLKRGDTGTLIWQVPFIKSNSEEVLSVYPGYMQDINDDGLMDVLIQIFRSKSGSQSDTVQARIGTNGTLKWKDSIKGNTAYLSAWDIEDINGDGIGDFLINGQSTNTATKTYLYKVKNAKTGKKLWSESVSYPLSTAYGEMYALPSGDLRGNGINTILKYSNPAKKKFSLTARTGPTGENLWSITSNKRINYIGTFSNFNGDAKDDVLFQTSRDIYAITTN